jgi:hypothetical protein
MRRRTKKRIEELLALEPVQVEEEAKAGEEIPKPDNPDDYIRLGEWYWYRPLPEEEDKNDEDPEAKERIGCITHLGSNYVRISFPGYRYSGWRAQRVHLDNIHLQLRKEPDPEAYFRRRVGEAREDSRRIMGEIQELCRRLGVAPQFQDQDQQENGLVVMSNAPDVVALKSSLIAAKGTQLPKLHKELESTHEEMTRWMTASILPAEAMAGAAKGAVTLIERQIFNIELYAGLLEEFELIRDGTPAPATEKLHVMQRRAYMDEECLIRYEAGGMDFRDLGQFEKWLSRTDNFQRILPFQRCMVVMRIRRFDRERGGLLHHISFSYRMADKGCYLYIRNGEKLYRLYTELQFDKKLFPDDELDMAGVYHITSNGQEIIPDSLYKQKVQEYVQFRHEEREYKKAKEQWMKDNPPVEEDKDRPFGGRHYPHYHGKYESIMGKRDPRKEYSLYSPKNVYYDDATAKLEERMRYYNRIAMLLQGLYDRSEVMNPHPPVRLWEAESFQEHIKLVFDMDRALEPANTPSFEEYRDELNKSIKPGSLVIGAQDYWERKNAAGENSRRRAVAWKYRGEVPTVTHFRPAGNPGPGYLARVTKAGRKYCTFNWVRARIKDKVWGGRLHGEFQPIKCSCQVPLDKLFAVEAYKPGDFRQFFDDPRTRADYIKWAPFLLAAEDYHAGLLPLEEQEAEHDKILKTERWN